MAAEKMSDPNAINLWISTNFVLFTMQWGERADLLVREWGVNAIVYMIPDSFEPQPDDKMMQIMASTSMAIRGHLHGMVSLVTRQKNPHLPEGVTEVSDILKVTSQDQLPGIWFIYSAERRAVQYPFKLDEGEISVNLLLFWVRQTMLEIELPKLNEYVKTLEQNETVELDLIETYRKEISQREEAYVEVDKMIDTEF